VAILRDGHVVIPQPETVFSPGDEVVALSSPTSESALRTAIVGDGMSGDTPPTHAGIDGAAQI
jgi:Trk K+ transport system NAD-binding subunit